MRNDTAPANRSGPGGSFSLRWDSRVGKWVVMLMAAAILMGLGYCALLRGVATFLVVEDVLAPAQAIVVLGGQLPFRAIAGANLYRAGWAPRVVLVRSAPQEAQHALMKLGMSTPEEWEVSHRILTRLGVPPSAILIPAQAVDGGTLEELQIAAGALDSANAPVILVTSKAHTRRARMTWHYVTGGQSQGIVHAAPEDPFDPARWWQERQSVLVVVREYLGLLHYGLGFPVAARAGRL
ncbi:MAG: YdcF family protein [Acidobacteria bacterium]|nr:YdcF family protein [Acidobacteriota bacterium]MBI3657917.1 YdcF family protein [Acidobacteriota bacterium]